MSLSSASTRTLPNGYTLGTTPDGEHFLVPTFLEPALGVALDNLEMKKTLDVARASGGPQSNETLPSSLIAAGQVMAPAVPGLTEREMLALHAEVKVLQRRYGLSYKDATHRLYMAEVAKLGAETKMAESLRDLRVEMLDERLQEIMDKIGKVDASMSK